MQTHRSFANTARLYGAQVIAYTENDITLSVPKLYFGYATGSNLFFPFAAGASTVLFPEPATAETLFEKIRRHKPTILVHVPTMIHKMLSHPTAASQDLSSLRLVTSAGEALPAEIDERWRRQFGVEILDGLGTAEMWHIFISNRPGESRPGTLGTVVPGFEVRVCDDEGRELLVERPAGSGFAATGRARLLARSRQDRPVVPRSGTSPAISSPWTRRAMSRTADEATRCSRWRAVARAAGSGGVSARASIGGRGRRGRRPRPARPGSRAPTWCRAEPKTAWRKP